MVRHSPPRRDTVSNSPMHQAAFDGDLKTLQKLLLIADNKKNINLKNHLGCTPLRLAATAGSRPRVELLIAHGADVNLTDIKGQTPLFVAVKNNHPGCVRALVSHGAHPDGSPNCLSSPLFIAAMQGHFECLQLLIEAGADVNCFLTAVPHIVMIYTPLHISFTYRHKDCFQALLIAGANPDCGLTKKYLEARPSLLDAAMEWGDVYFIELLVEFGGSMTNHNKRWKERVSGDHMTEKEQEVQAYLSVPRSLQSLCRLTVRKSLGVKRLASVPALPLPTYLKKYLQYSV
ncbi:ankyrin repeat and SOCS box protein 1-like [Patiria miniata]|uniref:SOCS box domain-containing protein n=1 Tax=Patiria miniata TaxID=46514 RepID=A0A914BQ15_PATMI|nr:ankyrin repeat and SOCS box protein 1-like [Patiria miniata]XP_038078239.1 ankyrin repeat and SOCS box protein 1-like [Patiria miniata]XP_038078240.1 ankyrin repeat and SOCS box protein 1-like [Patiria miniata]XP_038078241.1 ankyrin repeat and SOCS box protein 1-like [Patiria miniata]